MLSLERSQSDIITIVSTRGSANIPESSFIESVGTKQLNEDGQR